RIVKHLCLDLLPGRIPVRRIDLQLGGVEQLNIPTIPQTEANVRPIYAFSRYPYESRNRCHLAKTLFRGASYKICTTVAPHNKIICNITQFYLPYQIIDYLCNISQKANFQQVVDTPEIAVFKYCPGH
ncbi:hypothetical protein, partial [uncultured Alistipes sp.]|uniref:hypothetical protein n=2 Tax=uncultured Alistipes sp. TaxID=538949 RepID=UPI00272A79F8